ncbi:MAG: siroheme decarboxylase subunit beta [Gammaproteobacteria bacterium]
MLLTRLDQQLLTAIQHGLPIISRPYAALGEQLGISEQDVLERLTHLKRRGLIKRWGVIVKHRQLGYQANAMVVWDIPDNEVKAIGARISSFDFVNLCYRRPRHGTQWPYNLYCMIHGKSRETVLTQLQQLTETCDLFHYDRQILFSRRCFKQRGALYQSPPHCCSDG